MNGVSKVIQQMMTQTHLSMNVDRRADILPQLSLCDTLHDEAGGHHAVRVVADNDLAGLSAPDSLFSSLSEPGPSGEYSS